MATIQKISGVLANTGPASYTAPHSQVESGAIYDYLRIEGNDGRERYLEKVIVPSYLDVTLAPGMEGDFYIALITTPKLLGSRQLCCLFATSTGGQLRQAIRQSARCATDGNGIEAFKLLVLGTLLLPAFGYGMLFWLLALRLMLVKVPIVEMHQALGETP